MSAIRRIRDTITGGTPHTVLRDAVIADPDGAAHWIAELHADVANHQAAVQALRDIANAPTYIGPNGPAVDGVPLAKIAARTLDRLGGQ
jgi:hypothetical protein